MCHCSMQNPLSTTHDHWFKHVQQENYCCPCKNNGYDWQDYCKPTGSTTTALETKPLETVKVIVTDLTFIAPSQEAICLIVMITEFET